MTANEKAKTRAKAKTEQVTGAAKETAGRVVGNERLTIDGRVERKKGDAREAMEKIKDVGKH
ncbi:CsbD family protein [Streptomyces sp. NPDC056333]|uniref:CsbD family protein n=1 Tax=Streptomyces sp. NPDC056333 TaxID=3345786 RepID=UPI0035DCFD71